MRFRFHWRVCLLVAGLLGVTGAVADPEMGEALAPENVLRIATNKGDIWVEMRPDLAPDAVQRIRMLAREQFYDGLLFHRVLPGFVAQTGNPDNRDGSGSTHANLKGEFVFRLNPQTKVAWATQASDGASGFVGSVPVQTRVPSAAYREGKAALRGWGAYCTGVAGMGRKMEDRASANSELFFMFAPARFLDRDFTVWGRIVAGMDVLNALATGEPPAKADVMKSVRVLADLPRDEQVVLRLPSSASLQAAIKEVRQQRGADFSVCDVSVSAVVEKATANSSR